MFNNLAKTNVFMGSRLIGRPKQAQLRPKMHQDRVKMAKMGGD